MATIRNVIQRLFPQGTNRGEPNVEIFPYWPPDTFAAAATLVELCGCYSHPRYGGQITGGRFLDDDRRQRLVELAQAWRRLDLENESDSSAFTPIFQVQSLWETLLRHGDDEAARAENPSAATLEWWDAAIDLLELADEASHGLGFGVRPNSTVDDTLPSQRFIYTVLEAHRAALLSLPHRLPAPTNTLCLMVPPSETCVQPKATTPATGCTLRSLTHHLALLPPSGDVVARWLISPADVQRHSSETLNLLLVPFPFRIDGVSFHAGGSAIDQADIEHSRYEPNRMNFFSVQQDWLNGVTPPGMADFLITLIREARREAKAVHGVILPELALERDMADLVAKLVAKETGLELFICGVASSRPGIGDGRLPTNSVIFREFQRGEVVNRWEQEKHHRWRLDEGQIRRYHLGDSLSPNVAWWEKIDVSNRSCNFFVFRAGAALTALICEDLARVDPVQRLVRAIGPNLVVALLMDGPQVLTRWPSRYATVLAEDPGSAVLTLTSLGMLRRSVDPGEPEPNQIALWKDPRAPAAQELRLPSGAHALLLTIATRRTTEFTLDGRSDNNGAVKLVLSGVRPISHPREPEWARRT